MDFGVGFALLEECEELLRSKVSGNLGRLFIFICISVYSFKLFNLCAEMTAEVVIITKTAVTLAADSAATIGKKTYNSANKLFTLSKTHAVGIMIYNYSALMGTPLELIIKLYREKEGYKEHETLEMYRDAFISYLESFFSHLEQESYFKDFISEKFKSIIQSTEKQMTRLLRTPDLLPKDIDVSILTLVVLTQEIKDMHKMLDEQEFLATASENPSLTLDKFYSDKGEEIDSMINTLFSRFPLDERLTQLLREIAAFSIYKDCFSNWSGVVIAGYGSSDIYPSLHAFEMELVFDGKLKYRRKEDYCSVKDKGARVFPFAQDDVVQAFTYGVDPGVDAFAQIFLEKTFNAFSQMLLAEIGKQLDSSNLKPVYVREQIKNSVRQLVDNPDIIQSLLKSYRKDMIDYQFKEHYIPIIRMVEHLSKEELAGMAEALVNITSLKRRVSTNLDTVGGPIDVAVISKGDGFIWVKRKHYFDPELNAQFFRNYYSGQQHSSLPY